MIAAGWRKRAKVTVAATRPRVFLRPLVGAEVEELRPELYRHTCWWRRLWSVTASTAMAIALGAVAATIVDFGAAWLIINLSDKLKR